MQYSREIAQHDLIDELMPLFRDHWKEMAYALPEFQFEVDVDRYILAEAAGMLRLYIARGEDKAIAGYAVVFVQPSFHLVRDKQFLKRGPGRISEATQVAIYLRSDHRGSGAKFVEAYQAMLQEEGIEMLYHHAQIGGPMEAILEFLGHTKTETTWCLKL
jgi:hypothetical protein